MTDSLSFDVIMRGALVDSLRDIIIIVIMRRCQGVKLRRTISLLNNPLLAVRGSNYSDEDWVSTQRTLIGSTCIKINYTHIAQSASQIEC